MGVQINGVEQISGFGDYEEGTFTPQIADDNLNGSGESQAYTTQVGRYTKIGNRLYYSLTLKTSSLGCLATCEGARIVGLPFTSANIASKFDTGAVAEASGLAIAAESAITGIVGANQTRITLRLWDATTGTSSLLLSEWTADGQVAVSGFYEV